MILYFSLFLNSSLTFLGGTLFVVVLLLGLIACLVYRHRQAIKCKNKSLARNVDELMTLKEELTHLRKKLRAIEDHAEVAASSSETSAEPACMSTESQQIFEDLNRALLDGQLYLRPALSREDLTRLAHVDKNRLPQIIQENTGGNLKDYINGLRLDHAVLLMKTYPEYTLDTVASESGFANRSTFFLAFRKKNGMTPSQYKNENIRSSVY